MVNLVRSTRLMHVYPYTISQAISHRIFPELIGRILCGGALRADRTQPYKNTVSTNRRSATLHSAEALRCGWLRRPAGNAPVSSGHKKSMG